MYEKKLKSESDILDSTTAFFQNDHPKLHKNEEIIPINNHIVYFYLK